jgi:hypothetical protein
MIFMETEQTGMAQNAPATLPEIMEQLKVAQAAKGGSAIEWETLDEIVDLIHLAENLFTPFANTFTSKDRSRLVGGGIKNLGFIETAYESATTNLGLSRRI